MRQQPPPRKLSIEWKIALVLCVPVLAFAQVFVVGVTPYAWEALRGHEVAFTVSGTGRADISYSSKNGWRDTKVSGVDLPWESPTVRMRGVSQVYSILVVPESREHGTVTCEIWVDGRLVDSDRSLFEGSSASCLHVT